mmetsp:Transcript_7893/g.15215  ORF Transcript_7893/g.15215 Transcript_7893/m.15215 type:complete len:86 (-) Transcript_7893:199-456(-)|eukprot:CAMPEP_0174339760 /NCGR_PEP_ID=MMETSP0810-20121108/24160_1 /TAXON_ID=73025 ORGANISM="Eutreptiella gymnastica-like, Strain CCMP1594" /NCGR_SAMPLE_ID=MMETSP0810 /ASSEMBLY_ACC=CAM_ASM_000659 /LENGTH=85 /DNA_ID=CAMNT_0015460571 /DNA_START=723 /DNA_END=980 /DNA_ORIENTATION=-
MACSPLSNAIHGAMAQLLRRSLKWVTGEALTKGKTSFDGQMSVIRQAACNSIHTWPAAFFQCHSEPKGCTCHTAAFPKCCTPLTK